MTDEQMQDWLIALTNRVERTSTALSLLVDMMKVSGNTNPMLTRIEDDLERAFEAFEKETKDYISDN